MRQYFEQRQEEQQEMRRLVEATTRGHHNIQLMKDKLTAIKRRIGRKIHSIFLNTDDTQMEK